MINEELRQQLGELLSAKLYSMSHDGLGNFEHVDWTNHDNVDEVIDAVAPLLLQDGQIVLAKEAVPIQTTVDMARMMVALGCNYLKDYAPQYLTGDKPDDASAHNSQDPNCSCPSGNGSLRWPCPVHPPEPARTPANGDLIRMRSELSRDGGATWETLHRTQPDGYAYVRIDPITGPEYEQGAWSRRNWDAALRDQGVTGS